VRIDVVTIFPQYFTPLDLSLIGKARESGVVHIEVHDLRAWAADRHGTVDDTPYGGGAGMVMRAEPWGRALDSLLSRSQAAEAARLVVPTPSGSPFTQRVAGQLAEAASLIFACGRYEGIDQRVVDHYAELLPVLELSLGDYVVGGGEVAALAMIEACVRLVPGVVGNPASLVEESHAESVGSLLEYPVYTKPPTWRGHAVPDVLLSGHHGRIARWRRDEALRRTQERRPDLLAQPEQLGLHGGDSSG
jgi:tRNA (guanine37-N1)-methyltransferase